MLHRGLAALLIVCVVPAAHAQQWAEKMFDATSHDFGAVARGSKVEHRFRITNLYKEDVHIASVRSSCGCTSPEITKRTLKTHETSELIARFNTRAFLGHKSATVTVTFDQPFYAEVRLQVSGYIRSDVVLDPPAALFGSVEHGQPVQQVIAVRYAGRDDWAITGVEPSNPYVTAEVRETSRGFSQVSYELIVRLKENAPVGYLNDQLWVRTNDRRATRFPVTIEGRIEPAITVTPASLFLGVVEPGQTITKNVIVRGKRPFRILDVECDDRCFTFKTIDRALPVHTVRITFTAGEHKGKMSCKIRIKTDLDPSDSPELTAYAQIGNATESGGAQ